MNFRATEFDKFFPAICHDCLFYQSRIDEQTLGLPHFACKLEDTRAIIPFCQNVAASAERGELLLHSSELES